MKGTIAPPNQQLAARLYETFHTAKGEALLTIDTVNTRQLTFQPWVNLFAYDPKEFNACVAVADEVLKGGTPA